MISSTGNIPVTVSEAEVENVKKRARDNRLVLHTKKTREMVKRGRTKKSLPQQVEEVERKQELKIFGVTFHRQKFRTRDTTRGYARQPED